MTIEPKISARLDPDSIAIGDRFVLEVTVEKDLMQVVDFPVIGDEEGLLEIVEEGGVDTLAREGRMLTLRKSWTMTTFEEGEHSLGQIPVLYFDKNIVDTIFSSDSLRLEVGTFVIDTATMTIRDLKPLDRAPLKFGEFSGWMALGLLFAALVVSAAMWWRRRRRSISQAALENELPHERAIREMEELHAKKLWQNGKHKQYYTRLTDILRRYMEGRWGIAAMEMTSEEILAALSEAEPLREVLSSADLAKFAKYAPEAIENEAAWTKIYYFVENTKELTVDD